MGLDNSNKLIVLSGPVASRSGYGARTRDIARVILNLGFNLTILPNSWGVTPDTGLDQEKDAKLIERITLVPLKYRPDIFIQCTIPEEFQTIGYFNIGLTAGIETDICRPEWIEGCNKMDLVIMSSAHSKKVFEEAHFEQKDKRTDAVIKSVKLTTPIEVLFEGIDSEVYKKTEDISIIVDDIMQTVHTDFNFLVVGSWLQGTLGNDRKDIGMTIHTFISTFKSYPKEKRPGLLLKVNLAGYSKIEVFALKEKIVQIQNMFEEKDQCPIYLINGDFSDEQMNSLYNHPKVKALVSFTHGEGFGRPLLEFTTTGKPILASKWSGQLDFLDPEKSILLPGTVVEVDSTSCNKWIMEGSKWFNVNYNFASQKLDNVVQAYDSYLQRSEKYNTAEEFSLEKMAEKLSEYIDNSEIYLNIQDRVVQKTLKLI